MRFRREKDGALAVLVGENEAKFLRGLAGELRGHVEKPDFAKRIAQRLFPRYSDDDKINDELRQLLFEDQRKQKLERVSAFAAALEKIPVGGGEIKLSEADLDLWLALLSDLRLLYAAVIGIENDDWGRDINPSRPPSREIAVYLHLTDLQQTLLDHGFGVGFKRDWSKPR